MQPYEGRLVTEAKELDEKLSLLNLFVQPTNKIFMNLAPIDRGLLNEQYVIMQQYSRILSKRIDRFLNDAA